MAGSIESDPIDCIIESDPIDCIDCLVAARRKIIVTPLIIALIIEQADFGAGEEA